MHILGLTGLSHDASACVIKNTRISFAAHSERYSRIKNDPNLHPELLEEALNYVDKPDLIVWYEKPLKKKFRQFAAGQYKDCFDKNAFPKRVLKHPKLKGVDWYFAEHHESHAAAGFFTSPFREAAILVIDSIGEWDTLSIWHGKNRTLTKRYEIHYPDSWGLLYSAFTDKVGLTPNEDEYIFMGMAGYGRPKYYKQIQEEIFDRWSPPEFTFKFSLHQGIRDWRSDLPSSEYTHIASSVQSLYEDFVCETARWIRNTIDVKNLIIMGGCALNCVANTKIAELDLFDNIWIMPNPGDAGSALGGPLSKIKRKIKWDGPYLGTNCSKRQSYPVEEAIKELEQNKIFGIAHGKAEFGPRALGNRSLFADPRGNVTKDMVNDIKKRQKFRPFAPVILEEDAHEYFAFPKCVKSSPYMQFVAECKYPNDFPAITHVDGTSRVQTVNKSQHQGLYDLLNEWKRKTGCPILLNTSLNIKGEPLVNTREHADDFSSKYGITVL